MDLAEATPRTRAALTRQAQQLIKHSKTRPERSINRQDILTEEEYIEGLEKIIARDFFPLVSERLREREQEQEILAGFHSHDPDVVERSVRHMQHLSNTDPAWSERITKNRRNVVGDTPRFNADTPAGRSMYGETPVASDDPSLHGQIPQARYNAQLSLDDYQAKYTSEDNASFADIMDEENLARRGRYSWAFQAEKQATDKSRRAIEARQQLVDLSRRLTEGDGEIRLIEGSEPGRPGQRLLIEGRTTLPGDSASLEFAKRRLIAAPSQPKLMIEGSSSKPSEEKALTTQERKLQLAQALRENKEEIDKSRQESEVGTGVTAWPFTARNNFYFAPDANVPIQDTGKKTMLAKVQEEAVDNLGTTAPKGIRYNMTRIFDDDGLDEEARRVGVPPSPSHSNIAAAISGTPCKYSLALPAQCASMLTVACFYDPDPGRSSMTPRVQGYSFVDAVPSPSPSELGSQGVNALMTFGTLASTPVAIRDPNQDDPAFKRPAPPRETADEFQGGPFRISQTPRREMLAHKMASRASKSLSKRQQETGSSGGLGLLRMGSRTLASSTPAPSSVRSSVSAAESGATPGRDSFLSPAAKSLLGRAKGTKGAVSDLSPAIKRRSQEDRDKESRERLKRQKWDPSPLRSGVTQSQSR